MSQYYPDEQLKIRKKTFEADAALLDFIELFTDSLATAAGDKAEKVYCYCNIKGSAAIFRSFYTIGDKAFDLSETTDKAEYAKIEAEAVKQLELMRELYSYCTDKMPSELFIELDMKSKKIHALKADNTYSSVYDAKIRFKAWLEEHGGKGKPIGPRIQGFEEKLLWKLFKKGEETAKNPTKDAVQINMNALRDSREKAKEFKTASASHAPLVAYDYLEGDTGFLAIKDAFDKRYPDDESPDYLYYQDVDELRDDYKLFHKTYDYMLYEYIAIYEDKDSWHVISIGMSNLGAEADTIYTRYNAEYTMRIKKFEDEKLDEAESANAINLVAILADEACNSERMLDDYSYISLGHRKGMDYRRASDKVAFIIVPDARISSVETPSGTSYFRQAVPITRAEYQALKANQIDVKSLYEKIGTDLVDYDRPSVI